MVFGEKKKGTVTGNANASASGSGSGNGNGVSIGMGGDFRDPKRSVYYHEIFNPLGAPPPGMPYLEKREFRKVWRGSSTVLAFRFYPKETLMPSLFPRGKLNDNPLLFLSVISLYV